MSTSAYGATVAFGIGPSIGYICDLTVSMFNKIYVMSFMISMLVMVVTVVNISSSYMLMYVITNLLLFSGLN